MSAIRPFTAALLAAVLVPVALAGANPLVIVLTAAVMAVLSALAGGPRRVCFADAAKLAGLLMLIWLFLALLIDQPASGGAVVVNLPQYQLGAGVAIGGTKTVTWLEQMLITGSDAALAVLAMGLLAQLRSARDWLSFGAVPLGRGIDLVAPLVCLPESVLATRHVESAAEDLGPVSTRFVNHVCHVGVSCAELAETWRLDHPRRTGRLSEVACFLSVWVLAAVPVVMLAGPVELPLPGGSRVLTLGALSICSVLLVLSVSVHLPHHLGGWFPSSRDLPLVVAVLSVLVSWLLRHATGDDAALGLSPGSWPGLPPVLTCSLGLVVVAGLVTNSLERAHAGAQEQANA